MGRPRPCSQPLTQWSCRPALKDAPHDIDKARAPLTSAGFPHGFAIT